MRNILFMLLICSYINAEYINNSEEYSIQVKKSELYMQLVKKAYKNKTFKKEVLQKALNDINFHPLSDVLRIIAYDEIKDFKNIAIHLEFIELNSSLIEKDKNIAYALADVLLRVGEYEIILLMIPRNLLIYMSESDKNKGYYYRGMAKYLRDTKLPLSEEFLIAKYKFKPSKNIYKEYKKQENQLKGK